MSAEIQNATMGFNLWSNCGPKGSVRLIGIQAGRVVGLSFRMFAAIGTFRWAPAELFVLIATAISVAMASGVYTFFELPMQKYLRHAFN